MPHYKDGTPAKYGDIVKGRGYNVKHEIVGKVVGLTLGTNTCNIQVAHVDAESRMVLPVWPDQEIANKFKHADMTPEVKASIEYGQCDAFEKIS